MILFYFIFSEERGLNLHESLKEVKDPIRFRFHLRKRGLRKSCLADMREMWNHSLFLSLWHYDWIGWGSDKRVTVKNIDQWRMNYKLLNLCYLIHVGIEWNTLYWWDSETSFNQRKLLEHSVGGHGGRTDKAMYAFISETEQSREVGENFKVIPGA